MKPLIYIAACLFSLTGYAQTKLISFRSHSGNNANFRTAVEKDLFDIGNSNFGISDGDKIDSVILLSGKRIIVSRRTFESDKPRRDTLTRANASEIFAATNMQSLKAALQKKYYRPMFGRTHFIGFKFKSGNNTPKK